jgi:hypothetical protein
MGLRRIILAGALAAVVTAAPPAAGSSAHSWSYRAQVDGIGGKDAITITTLPGFRINRYGQGSGQVKVHVDLDGGGASEVYVDIAGYLSVRSPWTPWLGATDLDHLPGKELVIGFSTGAHAQLFSAYSYRDGQLLELSSPLGEGWMVNSSYGTGSSGWRCTRNGVEVRAVSSPIRGHVRITRAKWEWQTTGWVRTARHVHRAPVNAQGNPPAGTDRYPTFTCPGLPRTVL